MKYFSTRNTKEVVTSAEAIVKGLASDGGLFVPEYVPVANTEGWEKLSYPELAAEILPYLLEDFDKEFLKKATKEVYGEAFNGKAGATVKVKEGMYALELWHGPTCAFKDYALQLMPRLLVEAKRMLGRSEQTRILVATSGDTGKAALEGYKNLEGIDIHVFYPNDGTSEIQRLQMASQEGSNVGVYAVEGNFDDAQSGVKRVFADKEVAAKLEENNIRLSSANSINWGRLVPQIVYYFYSYYRVLEREKLPEGTVLDYCVPTGNFGDILAGYYAKQMGLPIGKLICASNKNNVLADFLKTGIYDKKRTFYKTGSPSMDILISSNLERLLYHVTKDPDKVAGWMKDLAEKGEYAVDKETLDALQEDFDGGWADEETCANVIAHYNKEHHYLADTHTAVAFAVADQKKSDAAMVVLSTASPYKFPRVVLEALGMEVPVSDFDAIEMLEKYSGMKASENLVNLKGMNERFKEVIAPEQIAEVALQKC